MSLRVASLWASLYMWLAIIALLLVTMVAAAEERTMCQAEPLLSPSTWWSWRNIDGRQCWYEGKPRKPREELYWPSPALPPEEPHDRLPNSPPIRWDLEHRWWG